jgi:hypothetical protein
VDAAISVVGRNLHTRHRAEWRTSPFRAVVVQAITANFEIADLLYDMADVGELFVLVKDSPAGCLPPLHGRPQGRF